MSATQLKPMPFLGKSPHRLVLSTHHVVEHAELTETLGRAFSDLYAYMNRLGVAPGGPPFVIYRRESEPEIRWVIDVCAPVSTPVAPTAEIQFRDMPEERIVSLVHFGPYSTLGDAYANIDTFIKEHGHLASGSPREIYLSEPDVPPEQIQTLIEQPIF